MVDMAAGSERRRTRESFTRTLVRICKRLDVKSSAEVQGINRHTHWKESGSFRLIRMWVVGSYARGAMACGDLDLVIELVDQRGGFTKQQVSRVLLGSPPDVTVYQGTPEDNTSYVIFDEAKLIWDGPGCSWQEAIEGIIPDPGAGRMVRSTDRIPFRRNQIDLGFTDDPLGDYEHILELEGNGVIQSVFLPIEQGGMEATLADTNQQQFLEHIASNCGRKTRQLAPYAVQQLSQLPRWPNHYWQWDLHEKTKFRLGGADVRVGKPCIAIHALDNVTTSQVILAPHITRRGPNGIWILKRGNAHPLTIQFQHTQAYCLTDIDGQPFMGGVLGLPNGLSKLFQRAIGLELFRSKLEAEERIRKYRSTALAVRDLTPVELLECLAQVDFIAVGSRQLVLTNLGCIELGKEKCASPADIVKVFAVSHQNKSAAGS